MVFEITLLLDIALILFVAKVFGEIAERLKVSSLVGEVFAGVLLGPILLIVRPDPFLEQIAGFGIIFLLFIIGLNTRFDDIKKDSYKAGILAILGAGFSFLAGFLIGMFLFNSINTGIFLGIAMLSTSTAITLRSLVDVGEIKTRIYEIAVSIDMADEVIAILALSLLTTYFTYGTVHIWAILGLFLAVVGFIIVIMTVGSDIVSRFLSIFKLAQDEHMFVSIPLVIAFVVAFISQQIGIAAVTGAFLAGMAMSKSRITESVIMPKMKILGYGFFIPLFFAYSAILFDLNTLYTAWPIILLFLAVGAVAKLFGIGYFSRICKFDSREQLMVGISMIPRGEYSIVITQIALGAGIITNNIYTIMISFVVLSIIITPILLKLVMRRKRF